MAEPKQLKAIKGGLNIAKRLLADTEEAGLTAAQRAEAGRKAAELIKSQPQVKASEALGQLMEKGFKKTTTTQADRTRVGGGNIGGAPFPAISEADPAYKGKVWGVMDEGTAARLKNLTDPETAWTTMLGSANQLKTNPIVFDKLKRGFVDSMKQGNLSDELAGKINHNLALTFGEGADIRDPKIWRQADTFEKRAALADVMMGQGTAPSKGGIAIGGEKSGKGVIFKPTDILKRETEPSLLHTEHGGDVPTFAAGPRLFRLNKESVYDPSLHPGFPTLLTGEDLKINMKPTPTEVYLRDWHAKFKKDNPERKSPGYYDLALGVKGEGLPSQDLNDEYIRHLLREGFKDGGEVDQPSLEDRLTKAIANDMASGGEVNSLESRLTQAIAQHNGMAEGGGAFKKIQFMEKGGKVGKLAKGISQVGKKLLADSDVLPAAERDANLAKFLDTSHEKRRLYHATPADFKEFQGKGFDPTISGNATWLTPNKEKQPAAHNTSSRTQVYREGVNVMPVHVKAERPLVLDDRNMEDWAKAVYANDSAEFPFLIAPDWLKKIKEDGYDSIFHPRSGEVIMLEPNKIKSAIGNRGTYDINERDITKAHGGIAHMDKGGKAGKVVSGLAKVGNRLLADPTAPRIVSEGDVVNGMLVRKDIPNTSSIGASLSNYSTHGLQEVPMSAFQTVGKPKYYSAQEEKRTKELARQIQENKELNPLIVVKDAEGHYILEGGHRFDALRELGIDSFPALMVHDLESLAKQLPASPVTKAHGGLAMAGGGQPPVKNESLQDTLKNIQNYSVLDQGAPRKPNELGGVVLAGASWMAGDEKTRLAKQLFGEDVTNTAIGGQKTSDVLNQLNAFERDGGTFAKGTTVVLDIGANDIAQGVDKDTIRKNLNEIVSRLGDSGVNVILSGQPEANSYEEAINSTTLQMDDLYNDIAAKHPNVTLVDAMSGMLNQKDLMDESGFHLKSDDAKLAYLSQFANAYKGANNQSETGIPKQVTQTDNVVDIPQEIAQITQANLPDMVYTPEVQAYVPQVAVEPERSAGYLSAQQNQGLDTYYQDINNYLAQPRTQEEIQDAMQFYSVSQADIDAAQATQSGGYGKPDESYATEQYAEGGGAFKKLSFYDKGGVTTSAGSFSPEELGVTANDLRVMDDKTWELMKKNAPATYEWAKQNVKDEASQLKTAKGMKDFALRVGASYAGAIPDFANLLLMAPDAVFGTELASEKPWFGSQQYLDAMNKVGMLGENEFPIAETVAGILTPAGLIKKGVKKVGNMRTSKETPKKRQGGLTAMAR